MPRRLEEIYVFVTHQDEEEGVAAFWNAHRSRLEPMIAVTEERLAELTDVAVSMVSLNPAVPIRIVRFMAREDVAEVVLEESPPQPA